MAGTIEHVYRYPFASQMADACGRPCARLATSGGVAEFPYFFQGALKHPRLTAQLLRVLAKVVAARYHVPPAMLEHILRECDPVVTSGGGLLRFEGFSACASAYARVDLEPDAYEGVVVGKGTTNVDFNAPFRAALAQVRDDERVGFAIGSDEVNLLRGADQIVERKVSLPVRWLKSFVEVQAYEAQMQLRADLGKIEAVRFLRSLPRTTLDKTSFWIVPAGSGLRVSQREAQDGIHVAGIDRLRVLEELAPFANRLRVYADQRRTTSEWRLSFGPLHFCLTISPDVWRGFSGEGQVLSDLARSDTERALPRVRQALQWQAELRAADLASAEVPVEVARQALAVLGSCGLVGYDLVREAYFHRELPFDLAALEELHPRLAGARELVAKRKIASLRQSDRLVEAEVAGSGVVHRVRLAPEANRCTCAWHAKHQGERGPCKHILAVQLQLEATQP